MIRTKEIVDTIYAEYSAIQSQAHPIVLYPTIRTLKKEAYHLRYERGQLHLLAESPAAAVFGAAQAFAGVRSRHWPEMMGSREARFSLRPLILSGEKRTSFRGGEWCLPKTALTPEGQYAMAKKILERGFNALILRFSKTASPLTDPFSMKEWLQEWKELGIQLIVELEAPLKGCPLEASVKGRFLKEWQGLSPEEFPALIFWESRLGCAEYEKGKAYEEATTLDVLLAELDLVEEAFSVLGGVVFSFSLTEPRYQSKYAHWLKWVTLMATPQTTIAFPAEIEGALNPFFQLLRFQQEKMETPLLPLLSLHNRQRGGGVWPIMMDEELERCLAYMDRHHFAGLALEIPSLPTQHHFLDWNLWVAGALQWGSGTARELAATWCRAFQPMWEAHWRAGDFDRVRRVASDLHTLSSTLSKEEGKAQAETLFATLDLLQARWNKKSDMTTLVDSFLVDARRLGVLFGERYYPAAKAQPLYPDHTGVWTLCTKKGDHYEITLLDTVKTDYVI